MWLSEAAGEEWKHGNRDNLYGFPLSKALKELYKKNEDNGGLGYLARELACHCNER